MKSTRIGFTENVSFVSFFKDELEFARETGEMGQRQF